MASIPPVQLMKNPSLGNSTTTEASTTPSAKSRLARLGVPFKSDPSPTDTRSFSVEKLIAALHDDSSRELALVLLCKVRTSHENLGPMLWDSNGTIFSLLKEIMHVYYVLLTPRLTEKDSNRVCNVLALLQCVASHPNTRKRFMDANIVEYLYPFINTTSQEKPHEFLRLTSLGVIGSLAKQDNADVVNVLLEGDIVSKLLLCLEFGNQLSKTLAAFVLERLLTIGEMGQVYCCASAQRFYSITRVLGQRIEELVEEPCQRLLKHIICCYIKLSENPRGCDGLVWSLPMKLRDDTFLVPLKDDPTALMWLQTLARNVTSGHRSTIQPPLAEPFARSIKGKAVMGSPLLGRKN
ncbi:CCR4-NOT transcription complex subunit 9 [Morus notabilis]|uniref:CCR4-NOT transcription complex subunit 9 n=1 Tax=Morus notabilis TaxID=981085 RepID=UPI000CED0AA8|nr:CCR4-NOT transcription complex subunit 9 [Morus notabilis]